MSYWHNRKQETNRMNDWADRQARSNSQKYKIVPTMNAFTFNEEDRYAVIGAKQKRSWKPTALHAMEHAVNLIHSDEDGCDEYLIVKVIGKVKRRKPPVDVTLYKN